MLEDLKRELAELSEKIARQEKISSMLASLQDEESGLMQKENELRFTLSKENADVERLEKTTAASIFYSILGKKEEKLEKEQQEAYAAKLKYDAAVRQHNDCLSRIDALRKEQSSLSGTQRRYDEVFSEIRDTLSGDPRYSDRLCELQRRLGEAASQSREVEEAIAAGNACMGQISYIEDTLGSARSWGTFDIIGGGIITDLVKHSKLDDAQCHAEQLQVLLSRFHSELADVNMNAQLGQVNVDGFLRFADYFFDGLVADWCVLSRISDSQASVADVRYQVSTALTQLYSLQCKIESQKEDLKAAIKELVINSK